MATSDSKSKKTTKIKTKSKIKGQPLPSPPTCSKQQIGEFPTSTLAEELFPQEYLVLQDLKARLSLEGESSVILHDRLLAAMLFARKYDIDRAEKMAREFLEWATTDPMYKRILKPKRLKDHIVLSGKFLCVPGCRSKEGYMIMYNRSALNDPKTMDRDDIIDWAISTQVLSFMSEGMDYHRNGACMVLDLKNVTWAQFDIEHKRKFMPILNKFPQRPQRILVLNPPIFFTALISVLRLFIKAKILSRIRLIHDEKDLLKYIDKDQLIDFHGGSVSYSPEEFKSHLLRARKRLFPKRNKKSKDAAKE